MVKYKYILEAIEKSYSHKPHLGALPHDLHTNDPEKLKERLDACKSELKKEKEKLKELRENNEMMDRNINDIDDTEQALHDEQEKLKDKNKQISDTVDKVYDHFEDVTMMTEEDGWEIKKQYDIVNDFNSYWDTHGENYIDSIDVNDLINDEEDALSALNGGLDDKRFELARERAMEDFKSYQKTIDDDMNEFIDEVSLMGYLPETYPKDDRIHPTRYIEDKLNPLIDNIKSIDTPESQKLASQLEKYRDDYNIRNDTPLTQKLQNIEKEGHLSDLYDRELDKNEKKIKQIDETIEKESKRREAIRKEQITNNRELKKTETRIKDYEKHQLKIEEKLEADKK